MTLNTENTECLQGFRPLGTSTSLLCLSTNQRSREAATPRKWPSETCLYHRKHSRPAVRTPNQLPLPTEALLTSHLRHFCHSCPFLLQFDLRGPTQRKSLQMNETAIAFPSQRGCPEQQKKCAVHGSLSTEEQRLITGSTRNDCSVLGLSKDARLAAAKMSQKAGSFDNFKGRQKVNTLSQCRLTGENQ